MSSFYGGKQGRTYHIVQRYNSVHDMVVQFKKGGAYTDANYGQYVLIDTVLIEGRSAFQNGLLYRRGFNFLEDENPMPQKGAEKYKTDGRFDWEKYQPDWENWVKNPGGGAIYVGQIVGPEGRTPEVTVKDWETFLAASTNDSNFGGKASVQMDVPGLKIDGTPGDPSSTYTYNDEIDVGYVNIVDTLGDIIEGYLAFDIPTPVFNITAQTVSAYGDTLTQYDITGASTTDFVVSSTYDQETGIRKYSDLIQVEPNSTAHSFFHKYDIAVPQGIHGQNVEEIKIETVEEINLADTVNPINIDEQSVFEGDQYFTYTTRNYDRVAAGDPKAHLGRWPYRVIDHIDPTSTVQRSQYESGNASKGQIHTLNSTYDSDKILAGVCIREGVVSEDIWENIGEEPKVGAIFPEGAESTDALWLVTTLPSTAAASLLRVDFTAGPDDNISFRNIDFLYVDESGKMFAIYSDDPTTSHFLTQVDSISSIDKADGQITIHHKNGTDDIFGIKQVVSIEIPSNFETDQDIIVTYADYNGETVSSTAAIGRVNSVLDIQRDGDTIRVLYSDPRVRNALPPNSTVAGDWIDPIYPNTTYYNLPWQRFGNLGSQYHVHGQVSFDDISAGGIYAYGLGLTQDTDNRQGWLVSVPDYKVVIVDDTTTPASTDWAEYQRVFAYNYVSASTEDGGGYHNIYSNNPAATYWSNWYEITSLADAVTPPEKHLVVSQTEPETLVNGGYWLKLTGGTCNHG